MGEKEKIDIHIIPPPLTMHDNLRRLTTIEPRRDLPVLILTLMTTTGRLSLPRGRTTTATDLLVVGAGVIGERGEDVGVPGLLLQLREEELCWGRHDWLDEGALPLHGQRLEFGSHCCNGVVDGVVMGGVMYMDGDERATRSFRVVAAGGPGWINVGPFTNKNHQVRKSIYRQETYDNQSFVLLDGVNPIEKL